MFERALQGRFAACFRSTSASGDPSANACTMTGFNPLVKHTDKIRDPSPNTAHRMGLERENRQLRRNKEQRTNANTVLASWCCLKPPTKTTVPTSIGSPCKTGTRNSGGGGKIPPDSLNTLVSHEPHLKGEGKGDSNRSDTRSDAQQNERASSSNTWGNDLI